MDVIPGNIHVYADRAHPSINESSWDTDFSDPSLGPPQSFTIDDTQTALSSVPLPFSTDDTYLSDWPEELCQPINRRQKHIPMYPSIKTIQFVGYAPNPRAHTPFRYFNIVPYHIEHDESRTSEIYEDNEPPTIPQFYRKLQLKRARNGQIDDTTVLKYNRTRHVPLESSASSTVVNPIVLVLYHVPALRNLFLCHICEAEHCIVCQLGFLFRMISDKIPSQAAMNINLVRSLMAAGSPPIQGEPMTTTQHLFTYVIESVEKTRMEETRKVKRLPPIILVDTNPGNPKFAEFWQEQLRLSEVRPRYKKPDKECSFEGGAKCERPCRYGSDCRNRLYCKYSHGFDDWEAECAAWLEDTGGDWKHFTSDNFHSRISNGIAILSEQPLEKESDTYELMAIVAAIGDGNGQWTHTIIQINDREKELPWCIINETLVTRIHSKESLHLNAKWKLPLILCYVNKSSGLSDVMERRRLIPPSVFHTDSNLTGNDDVARERRGCDIPSHGEVIGIDAEFINISKDHGRKSVGRVSCVDSTGGKILIDDYVVTCDGDVVDDYLTQYRYSFNHCSTMNLLKCQYFLNTGTLDAVVRALYDTGKQCNWRLGTSPSKSLSPFSDLVRSSSPVSDPLAFASSETSFEAA
uniref:C3H1-type domain-containing protein n=1 Tax=Heterorhabditis bacteriophora TaxID=37862 RepID=A0A1I7XSL9_HETBA